MIGRVDQRRVHHLLAGVSLSEVRIPVKAKKPRLGRRANATIPGEAS